MSYAIIEKRCDCCGRIFVPAPYHIFKGCCSYTCYNKSVCGEKTKKPPRQRPVNQYDLNGNYIATFPSLKKASIETGVSYETIRTICNGATERPHKYIFKYA